MKVLVLGATGATGKHLAEIMLNNNYHIKVIVRSKDRLPEKVRDHKNIEIIEANVLDFDVTHMSNILKDCDAAGICLGHNLTFKGMYGKPRKLVRDAVRLICDAVIESKAEKSFRLVLMNTTAVRNKDKNEKSPFGEKIAIGLLRLLLPPQSDNETAAEHLRIKIGQDHPIIEWSSVRPYNLINDDVVSEYETEATPETSPVFDKRQISRINVAHFMAQLIIDQEIWEKYKGQMPVIRNQ